MFNHWMEIVHNHDNGYLVWLFHQNVFPLRESSSIISGNGKGFTLEKLFRSPFSELKPSFPFNSVKKFFQSSVDGLSKVFAFELYYSLFHMLMIKNSYQVDQALFDFFFFNYFEIL